MPREHICAYGACDQTAVPISANTGDERPRFCSHLHAALWFLKAASYAHHHAASRLKLAEGYDKMVALSDAIEGPR